MANTITGLIHRILPIETEDYNGRTYYKRLLVLDATRRDPWTGEPLYPSFPSFVFDGEDRCNELDKYKVGQVVTITFYIQGNKYKDKETGEERYFTRIKGTKIALYRDEEQERRRQPEPPVPAQPKQGALPWE